MSRIVVLAGIGPGGSEVMTEETRRAIRESDCLIGASRMTEAALLQRTAEEENSGETKERTVLCEYEPEVIARAISENIQWERICIVLSGDVGFHSAAKRLRECILRACPDVELTTLPGICSIVCFAARLGVPWEDARLLSMHGESPNYIYELIRHRRVFMLLGANGCGAHICERFAKYDLDHVRVCIGKNLSYKNEQIICRSGGTIREEDFDGLSVVYFENDRPETDVFLSVPDTQFIRGRAPMTKEEVRTLSVASLGLKKNSVLYDVGAGTGSVGIQAALTDGTIRVYAVEKKKDALELIRLNKNRFAVDFLEIVEGEAPECIQSLPPCTHAFIGGTGGRLHDIIRCIRDKNEDAVIVINAISLETVRETMEAVEAGLLPNVKIVQVGAARAKVLGRYHMMTGENPIYIITSRPEEDV